ncbi:Uncharacterised protein [Pseudomonas fluorescens]|uniref:Uncharacterized protein n=1 Tax=Pseudomonas fluorescens TaxID=294 RepID=A0A448DYK4_PSEFL|nr:Uncharacterised protein [Pseudomonas fluorescens]
MLGEGGYARYDESTAQRLLNLSKNWMRSPWEDHEHS